MRPPLAPGTLRRVCLRRGDREGCQHRTNGELRHVVSPLVRQQPTSPAPAPKRRMPRVGSCHAQHPPPVSGTSTVRSITRPPASPNLAPGRPSARRRPPGAPARGGAPRPRPPRPLPITGPEERPRPALVCCPPQRTGPAGPGRGSAGAAPTASRRTAGRVLQVSVSGDRSLPRPTGSRSAVYASPLRRPLWVGLARWSSGTPGCACSEGTAVMCRPGARASVPVSRVPPCFAGPRAGQPHACPPSSRVATHSTPLLSAGSGPITR
jgi:hypothetical protein